MEKSAASLLFMVLTLVLAGCETPDGDGFAGRSGGGSDADAAYSELLDLVEERLDLMHGLARYKWSEGIPVDGTGRDDAALQRAVAEGETRGLSAFAVESFLLVQMEAGRLLQQVYFDRWSDVEPAESGVLVDYESGLEPALREIESAMVAHLARVHAAPPSEEHARERLARAREALLESGDRPEEIVDIALSPFQM